MEWRCCSLSQHHLDEHKAKRKKHKRSRPQLTSAPPQPLCVQPVYDYRPAAVAVYYDNGARMIFDDPNGQGEAISQLNPSKSKLVTVATFTAPSGLWTLSMDGNSDMLASTHWKRLHGVDEGAGADAFDSKPKTRNTPVPTLPAAAQAPGVLEPSNDGTTVLIWLKSVVPDATPAGANCLFLQLVDDRWVCSGWSRTRHCITGIHWISTSRNRLVSLETPLVQHVSKIGKCEASIAEYIWNEAELELQDVSNEAIQLPASIATYAWNDQRSRLAIACVDNAMLLFSRDGALLKKLSSLSPPSLLCWHSLGTVLASGSRGGDIHLWDLALNPLPISKPTSMPGSSDVLKCSSTQMLMAMGWVSVANGETSLVCALDNGEVALARFICPAATLESLVSGHLRY